MSLAIVHEDGWRSALSGLGDPTFDKRLASYYSGANVISPQEARELWRGDDLAARVIEVLPREMMRAGFRLRTDDKAYAETVMALLEELDASGAFERALQYERCFGGAAIWPVTGGGRSLSSPRGEARGEVTALHVFEASELDAVRYYEDPFNPKFRQPEIYRLRPSSETTSAREIEIHESRLIIFHGVRTGSGAHRGSVSGWGDSVLTRLYAVLRDYQNAWNATGVILSDFSQSVMKVKGLAEALALDRDDLVVNRMRAVELARSTARAVLIDAEEDYARQQTPITGLPDLLDRFATRFAAAADMPATLLFGMSPAGLNATGESDTRFFYDRVSAAQRKRTRQLEQLLGLFMPQEPEVWGAEWNPLWQPSDKELAEARQVQAQTDAVYITNGVLSPDDVAKSRFAGDTYSFETSVDFANRDAQAESRNAAAEEMAEAEKAAADEEEQADGTEI